MSNRAARASASPSRGSSRSGRAGTEQAANRKGGASAMAYAAEIVARVHLKRPPSDARLEAETQRQLQLIDLIVEHKASNPQIAEFVLLGLANEHFRYRIYVRAQECLDMQDARSCLHLCMHTKHCFEPYSVSAILPPELGQLLDRQLSTGLATTSEKGHHRRGPGSPRMNSAFEAMADALSKSPPLGRGRGSEARSEHSPSPLGGYHTLAGGGRGESRGRSSGGSSGSSTLLRSNSQEIETARVAGSSTNIEKEATIAFTIRGAEITQDELIEVVVNRQAADQQVVSFFSACNKVQEFLDRIHDRMRGYAESGESTKFWHLNLLRGYFERNERHQFAHVPDRVRPYLYKMLLDSKKVDLKVDLDHKLFPAVKLNRAFAAVADKWVELSSPRVNPNLPKTGAVAGLGHSQPQPGTDGAGPSGGSTSHSSRSQAGQSSAADTAAPAPAPRGGEGSQGEGKRRSGQGKVGKKRR